MTNKLKNLEIEARDIIKNQLKDNNLILSFSGGADSSVINHLIQKFNLNINHIYFNKDVENIYNRRIINIVKKQYKHVHIAKPKMNYREIVHTYGFPIGNKNFSAMCYRLHNYYRNLSKKNCRDSFRLITGYSILDLLSNRKISSLYKLDTKFWYLGINYPIQEKCCNILKKEPAYNIEKELKLIPIIGVMKSDSPARRLAIGKNFINNRKCFPLANWTKEDVLNYIEQENIILSKIYIDRKIDDDITIVGATNSGCPECHFGQNTNQYIVKNGEKIKTTKFKIMGVEKPKQLKATLNMTHKNGITFKETIDIFELSKKGYFLNESILLRNKFIKIVINLFNNLTDDELKHIMKKYIEKYPAYSFDIIKTMIINKLESEIK